MHGGTSGIGTMAIQLARNLGARVIVTAGLGGEAAALPRARRGRRDQLPRGGLRRRSVRAATDGHGADVILDNMGAKYLARNIAALAVNGRLVVIGMQGGTKAELDLGALMGKRAAVLATSLRARPPAEKAAIVASVREHVWPLLESGAVRPVVDRVLPLADAAEAHRVVEAGEHVGKVLARPAVSGQVVAKTAPYSVYIRGIARSRGRSCRSGKVCWHCSSRSRCTATSCGPSSSPAPGRPGR